MSRLTESLEAYLRMHNSWEFARIGGARLYIAYGHHHAHAIGYTDPRASVMRWNQDRRNFVGQIVLRIPHNERGTYAQTRDRSFEMARNWVDENYRPVPWKRTPYNDAWVPETVYDRVMNKLKEAQG